MGPRPLGRGDAQSQSYVAPPKLASMGPRPLGRGDRSRCLSRDCPSRLLQWGRDLSAAETDADQQPVLGVAVLASMGPRPLGRGDRRTRQPSPSPSPRSFNGAATSRPRRPKLVSGGVLKLELQWGRDLSAAETGGEGQQGQQGQSASMGPRPLGRGDHIRREVAKKPLVLASMGPRPLGRGDVPAQVGSKAIPEASMGPRPLGRGDNLLLS